MSRLTASRLIAVAILLVIAVYVYFGIQLFYGGLGDV